jgi:hypothetical protein
VDLIHLAQEKEQAAGYFEHGNEIPGARKREKYLDSLNHYLLKKG